MGNCLCQYLVLNLVSYKFHQHLFCVFLFSSQCMCGSSLIYLFGWLHIHLNSLVLCLYCLAMFQILNHSLGQVNVNLPEYLYLPYKSILIFVCVLTLVNRASHGCISRHFSSLCLHCLVNQLSLKSPGTPAQVAWLGSAAGSLVILLLSKSIKLCMILRCKLKLCIRSINPFVHVKLNMYLV